MSEIKLRLQKVSDANDTLGLELNDIIQGLFF